MAKSVTFKCSCPLSVVSVTIQASSDPSDTEGLLFKTSGSRTVQLSAGAHDLSYRAVGTPLSALGLELTDGGEMRPIDRKLGEDGRAAGLRTVTVS
jgi:hypothetical protein